MKRKAALETATTATSREGFAEGRMTLMKRAESDAAEVEVMKKVKLSIILQPTTTTDAIDTSLKQTTIP